MMRSAAALAVFALLLGACGRYGPPVRRPAPAPAEAAADEAGAAEAHELEGADRETVR